MSIIIFNANLFLFLSGILQSPFFNLKYPKSLNYGAMGFLVGHELAHAFDDQGRELDANGNMREWWTKSASKNYKRLTKCMSDQYSRYSINDENGENPHEKMT